MILNGLHSHSPKKKKLFKMLCFDLLYHIMEDDHFMFAMSAFNKYIKRFPISYTYLKNNGPFPFPFFIKKY